MTKRKYIVHVMILVSEEGEKRQDPNDISGLSLILDYQYGEPFDDLPPAINKARDAERIMKRSLSDLR